MLRCVKAMLWVDGPAYRSIHHHATCLLVCLCNTKVLLANPGDLVHAQTVRALQSAACKKLLTTTSVAATVNAFAVFQTQVQYRRPPVFGPPEKPCSNSMCAYFRRHHLGSSSPKYEDTGDGTLHHYILDLLIRTCTRFHFTIYGEGGKKTALHFFDEKNGDPP